MRKQYSLAYLTVRDCEPAEMAYIASRTGYDYISLRLIPMGIPGESAYLPKDRAMISRAKTALKETGIKVLDIELARILDDFDLRSYLPAFEVAAELGAKHVISSAWTTQKRDRAFIVDRFSEICDLAKPFDLTVNLEFPTFSRLTNLKEAADIVRAANRTNGGILIDSLYFHYSRIQLEELEQIPREYLNFMHICDTSKNIPTIGLDMINVAREERLYVGEGCIDFAALLSQLPLMPYSIELPNKKRLDELGFEGHARRCLETAKKALDHVKTGI
jgi:sugar phosphate isomerase/epimerase